MCALFGRFANRKPLNKSGNVWQQCTATYLEKTKHGTLAETAHTSCKARVMFLTCFAVTGPGDLAVVELIKVFKNQM